LAYHAAAADFFLLAKTHRGGQDAKSQLGQLPLTKGVRGIHLFILAKPQSRKGIVVHSVKLPEAFATCPAGLREPAPSAAADLEPAPQNCGEPNTFFIFYSRKGAETQRNCGPLDMTFRRGGLPLRLGGFARLIFFLFSSRQGGFLASSY
jgi:hypothetical protein